MYRSLVREQTKENRERIDNELENPGHQMKRIENHPAVKKDPELGIRLRFQERLHSAATETQKNKIARELGEALVEYRQTGIVPS